MTEGIVYRTGPTILLRSGAYFDLLAPETSAFTIGDIAHALSHLCRFTGHVHKFYSVAEHSWHCSTIVPPKLALHALMHDAAEAFIGDVAKPLKVLLPGYREIEKRIEAAVLRRCGLDPEMPPEVKQADLQMLRSEQRWCMRSAEAWPGIDMLQPIVRPAFWEPREARRRFLDRFEELGGKVGKNG